VHAIGSKPLVSIGNAISNWAKPHRSLECTKMLVALLGPGGHTLKVDRSMFDLIEILKADCHEIQEC
jgi:hypothetical protein